MDDVLLASLLTEIPDPLAARVRGLHRCTRHREHRVCRQVADTLRTAALCLRYGEAPTALELLRAAVDAAGQPGHGHPVTRGGWPPGVTHGRVERWADRPGRLVAATDASCSREADGYAYVVSDGRWGVRGRPARRRRLTDAVRVVCAELRAVALLLSRVEPDRPLEVVVDSREALTYLQRWRTGDRDVLPPGYDPRPRPGGRPATLTRLAARVAAQPDLVFRHVKAHRGHPLNEAADALSTMARRRVTERFDLPTRAGDLVDAFLSQWWCAGTDTVAGAGSQAAAETRKQVEPVAESVQGR